MKSLGTRALIACTSLLLAADQAAAQYGSPSLLPLPAVTAVDAVTASYDLPATNQSPYGTVFSNQQAPQPAIPTQTPESIIPGASGNTQFQEAIANEWNGGSGCAAGCGEECCAPRGGWFGSAGALVMGRNRANPFWTTYETNVNENQLMNTQNAGVDWQGGWEFTGGYMFGGLGGGCATPSCEGVPFMNCGGLSGPGIAFTYWGLAPMNGFSEINSPTNELSTPINLEQQSGPLEINGVPMSDYFDNAASHRIYRTDNVNNFELNGLLGAWTYGRLTTVPFVGFRYFRFGESLAFQGLAGGGSWDDPNDWAEHRNKMVNNMYGFQVGAFNNYMIGQRWGLFLTPKVGVFANQMNGRTVVQDGNGNLLQDSFGNVYDIQAHKTDFSMLGELDAGVSYFWRPNVFSYVGYRVVGIANVALSDNQFLPYEADYQGFREINQNGSLILHGVMLGGGFFF
jgi:hypothetical protein